MPGSETNTTIMQGLNELIVSVNDLALVLFDPNNETNVLELIEFVGDNVESLRSTLETRSIAETTAQNTNFSDLITAINALTLTCAPTINNNVTIPAQLPPIVIPDQDIALPPKQPITEPDSLPAEEQLPTKTYDIKCRVANAIHENILTYWQNIYDNDVDDIANLVGTGGVSIVIGAIFGLLGLMLSLPVAIVGIVLGAVTGLAASLAAEIAWGDIDADQMINVLTDNGQDLVCALYTGYNYYEAKQQYLQVLSDNGLNASECNAIGLILIPDVVNNLFGLRSTIMDYYGENFWAALDGYDSPPYTCDSCSDPDTGVYDFSLAPYNWEINYSVSNYTPSYEAACCFKTVTSVPNVTPVICIDQTAPHDVGTITIDVEDYQSATAANVYVDVADTYGGTYTNIHSWTTGPNRDIVSAAINQTGKYVRVRLQCFASPWVKIHKITYS